MPRSLTFIDISFVFCLLVEFSQWVALAGDLGIDDQGDIQIFILPAPSLLICVLSWLCASEGHRSCEQPFLIASYCHSLLGVMTTPLLNPSDLWEPTLPSVASPCWSPFILPTSLTWSLYYHIHLYISPISCQNHNWWTNLQTYMEKWHKMILKPVHSVCWLTGSIKDQ